MTFPIPNEALENHIAILGKTGSGKSNAAKVIAERLLHAGKRVCAIDPTGTWWGLRLSEDGKHPSPWPVVIFGGEHADLPISAEHGAAIAETIGSSSTSAIIDTRQMSVGARTQFFTAFAETLIARNQGELALIIDEAHLFAPQTRVNDPKSSALVHATNNLVSLGRGVGLRIMLLSQRPAKLHKDSLTQVETLVAMRLIHNLDVDAVKTWIGEWADPAKGKEITSALPSLPKGDAFVWAPELDYLKRDHFPLVATFDTGKPLAGKKAPTLKAIDLEKIKERLTTVAKEALANDPKVLRAEIATLKRELASKLVEKINSHDPAVLNAEYDRGYGKGHGIGYASGFNDARERLGEFFNEFPIQLMPKDEWPQKLPTPAPIRARVEARGSAPNKAPLAANSEWTGPQRRILNSLAFWHGIGHAAPSREQVALVAGYSPNSTGFTNPLGALRAAGQVEYPSPGTVKALVATGDDIPGESHAAATLRNVLTGPQWRIVEATLNADADREKIAERAGYSASSTGFTNPLGSLRSLGLVEYPLPGQVALTEWARELLQ